MNILNLLKGNITQEDLLRYYNTRIFYIDIPYRDIKEFVDYYKGYYNTSINKNLSYYKKEKSNSTRIISCRIKSVKSS